MTNKKLPNSDLSPAEIYRKYADIVSESMNDRLRYVHSKGKQYTGGIDDSGLPGTEYDPDTGDMHVRNSSSLGATHQELEKRGWKHKAGDREQHPAGGAQWSNDTDYRLGEAGMKEKTTVTLSVKDLLNALVKGTLVGKKITSVDWTYRDEMVDAGRGNATYEKAVSGVTLGIKPAGGMQKPSDLGEAKPYTSAGEKPFTDEEKIRLLFDRGDKKGLRKMQSMIPGNLADHISWSNIESSIAALDRMPQESVTGGRGKTK